MDTSSHRARVPTRLLSKPARSRVRLGEADRHRLSPLQRLLASCRSRISCLSYIFQSMDFSRTIGDSFI